MSDSPSASAAKAVAGALLRHGITTAGTALVARGWIDHTTAASATGPIADYLFGAGLVAGSAAWAGVRARAVHWRWVKAWIAPAKALPGPTS